MIDLCEPLKSDEKQSDKVCKVQKQTFTRVKEKDFEKKVLYLYNIDFKENNRLIWDMKHENDLRAAIKFGTEKELYRVIDIIIRPTQEVVHSDNYFQAYLISAVNTLLQMIQQERLDMKKIFGQTPQIMNDLTKISNSKQFRTWFYEICFFIKKLLKSNDEVLEKTDVERAKEYIMLNYMKSDLTVNTIASFIGLTPPYFSTVFKKETGESCIGFLSSVRMSKAVELLEQTQEKSYRISELVGYTDPTYFSSVFKKKFGIAPSKYRDKVMKKKNA